MYEYKDLYVIDFSSVNHYLEIHDVIRESLEFPDYYGCNWDAFWDCLTDMICDPVHIQIRGIEVIEQERFGDTAEKMLCILKDFKHYENDEYADTILIEIIDSKTGKITVLE